MTSAPSSSPPADPSRPLVAVVVAADGSGAVVRAPAGEPTVVGPGGLAPLVADLEARERPRWGIWSSATARALAADEVHLATAWDASAVHRLLVGGWHADPGRIWASAHGSDLGGLPADGPVDLFNQSPDLGDAELPVRSDGYLRPEWMAGDWSATPGRIARWAEALSEVIDLQHAQVAEVSRSGRPNAERTARSESTAELLCAEMAVEGLPVDRGAAEAGIAAWIGPRPTSLGDLEAARAARDALVLRHAPAGTRFDLRSPNQVRSLLRSVGIEVPDTRAGRLREMVDVHPVIADLLQWRKAERVENTFGYDWLDQHLGDDGRFRGDWSGSDGAAGRMTASAGLHNMPADLRGGVVAEAGHVFVRSDLGQIEPRVLAAVSGDRVLAAASRDDDLYAPVASQLGVDRATAKVAVLGAMYGQTTGHGAQALRGLQRSYPVAIEYLEAAARTAQVGNDLRTYGGRLVRMGSASVEGIDDRQARSQAAARGRFGRNAMVQGAAAELFKVWAVTVRARGASIGARIVLCLHDELLVHVPVEQASAAVALVDDALQEAAARWAPDRSVRFLTDTSVVHSWAEAKG